MQPLSAEWVLKAEGDFETAKRELRARKAPNYDAACFHAQQCAEKFLKARLQEAGIVFTRTHSLTALLDLARLSAYAVEYRYPGDSADRELAKEAVAMCTGFRRHARLSLGLSEEAR